MRASVRKVQFAAIFTMIGGWVAVSALAADANQADLVNRRVLRVCATPQNLPYSNEQGEGFENKIAEIIADELKIPVEYTWFPQGPGLVRRTLAAKKCDVLMQTVQADEYTLNTNHYYRTTYALVYREGHGLDGVKSLFDERLKGKKIGIQGGVPPSDQMAKAGLMANGKFYRLMFDSRYDNPMEEMVKDVRSGDTDAAVLWGPFAGYYATRGGEKLVVAPLLDDDVAGTSKLEFRMTMGVRNGDTAWKRQLNDIIKKRQGDIDQVLLTFGVPLIDEDNKPIATARH